MPIKDLPLPLRALYCRPLMLFAACFGIGAVVAQGSPLPLWLTFGCASALLLSWALIRRVGGRSFGALVMAAGLFLGAARMTLAVDAQPSVETRYSVQLAGTIADDPLVDAEKGRLTCRLTNASVDGEPLSYDMRLYLRGGTAALGRVRIGQRIEAKGHLWAPERATNPGAFDFSQYLWRNGMAAYATAQLSDATVAGESEGIAAWLSGVRRAIGARIDALFPRSADLVRALLLGDRSEMSEDLRESFSRAGVSHVLSISGLHITLLAMAAMTLFRLFLPRRAAFSLAFVLILFYGVLVGMQPPVLRSILMYVALCMGQLLGRPSDGATRLSLAFLLLAAWNPLYLSDAGFVLSFSASAGMLCLSPALLRVLRVDRIPQERSLRPAALGRKAARYFGSLVAATLAAQLATLPAIVAYYGKLPVLATIANLAVVPMTLIGMLGSIAALALSFVWSPLGAIVAFLSDHWMRWTADVTRLCAGLPLSDVRMPPFPAWLAVAHACLLLVISELSTLPRRAREWLLAALPAAACLAVLLAAFGQPGLTIVFLDAGQADAAVIRAENSVYLVDVGLPETPSDDYLTRAGLSPKAVFLSHPHDDHAGGLDELLDSFVPEAIYVPVGWYAIEADEGVSEAVSRAQSLGSKVVELSAGDVVPLSEGVRATVLHPAPGAEIADPNGISMVLLIEYGDAAALFTGDLPIGFEPGPMPDVDVLKVAHHGSNGSSSYMALFSASPSASVVSVGRGNSYGHPGEKLLERLAGTGTAIYRTDLRGAVTAELQRDGGVRVKTQLAPEG
ncbi:MAG: DNA internalization-related competence protein ComEC/Rec2 [Clostridiales bacterium]|nr:DNA internalization-related competence protein ComEC/Rec2 [Clostridiales bacterium]